MPIRTALALLLLGLVLCAQDWPQWRGPNRDAVLPPAAAPKAWPEKLTQKWRVEAGEGHSSPVLAGGRIYLLARRDEQEVLYSIDPVTGKILWQQAYRAPYEMNPAAVRHGKGPKSTPLVHDGAVYTLGISGVVSAYDAASGKLRWRKEFSRQYRQTSPLYGAATSPLIDSGLLIAGIGGHDNGALAAFDTASGEMKWAWKEDGPAYASPVVAEIDGARQVITQTQRSIIGVSVKTGELFWRMPFTTPYDQNIVTPLVWHDTLILSGLGQGVFAVRVGRKDGRWAAEKLWHNSAVSMYMSSPVVRSELLFGFSHRNRGQLFVLNAKSGQTLWTGEPRQGDNAALILAGDYLLVLTDAAELSVARPDASGLQPRQRYTVASSPTWAHPLILPHGVVIKDVTSLALWALN